MKQTTTYSVNRSVQSSKHCGRPVSRTDNRVLVRAAQGSQAASEKAALRVAVYSAQRYVHGFLKKPLLSAFPDSTMIEVFQHWRLYTTTGCTVLTLAVSQTLTYGIQGRLDQHSATFAAGHQAVCLFVNDDGSAPVSANLLQRSAMQLHQLSGATVL